MMPSLKTAQYIRSPFLSENVHQQPYHSLDNLGAQVRRDR